MILSALNDYYHQLLREAPETTPERGWSRVKVTCHLVLSETGELVDIVPAPDRRGWMERVPEQAKRSSNVAPRLLADNATYLLGVDIKGGPEWTRRCFNAAKRRHLEVFSQADSVAARALCAFFNTWDPEMAGSHPAVMRAADALLTGGNLSFALAGEDIRPVSEDEQVILAYQSTLIGADGVIGRCLVTGEESSIVRIHPLITGVKGGSPTGTKLVSFNQPSFSSYGHAGEQGLNAPVSEDVAFGCGVALNHLLRDPTHHLSFGDTTIVWWAEHGDAADSSMLSLLLGVRPNKGDADETADAKLETVFGALLEGELPDMDGLDLEAPFHVIGLVPNRSRLSIRFHEHDSFEHVLENLMRHYRRLSITHATWQRDLLTPYQILAAAENPKAKKPTLPPNVASALLYSMLTDTRYPESLYANIMERLRATQDNKSEHVVKVSYERVAFIKAYLIKNASVYKEDTMRELDPDREDTAYLLGRLFSKLKDIQHAANPELNSTIADKYLNRASSTPAQIFPTLLRLSTNHLAKIRHTKPGLACNLEKEMRALVAESGEFPTHLSYSEQGDFLVGYYQQQQADIQERVRKKQERENAALSSDE